MYNLRWRIDVIEVEGFGRNRCSATDSSVPLSKIGCNLSHGLQNGSLSVRRPLKQNSASYKTNFINFLV